MLEVSNRSFVLCHGGPGEIEVKEADEKVRLPSQPCHPAPPWGSQGVSRPDGICNPFTVLWVCPGVSFQLDVPLMLTGRHREWVLLFCESLGEPYFIMPPKRLCFSFVLSMYSVSISLKGSKSIYMDKKYASG